jgi:hypothetical protein
MSTMNPLDTLYLEHLRLGFLMLRLAVDSNDASWTRAETELLHNIPSLICETNPLRHIYFWEGERELYIDWSNTRDEEMRARIDCYYLPIWEAMQPLISALPRDGG